MMRHLLATCALLASLGASAAGIYIPAGNRVDMVHDFKRDIVYVTTPTQVLRYDRAGAQFLAPIVLGGDLKGIDISADGDKLAVADHARAAGYTDPVRVHIVDLANGLAVTQLQAPPYSDIEAGTWSVAFGPGGTVMATTGFFGSGWRPMRHFDLATGALTQLAIISDRTMLAASGDRTRLAFAESNISDGRWGRYTFATGLLEKREWYENGTSWFNWEIGTNRTGTQYAIPTYGGTFFYDNEFVKVATIGTYAGPQPLGVAYHPVENLAYFPWVTTNQVRVYDTTTFSQVGAISTGYTFSSEGNWAYRNGRTKLSIDGSLLMVTVAGGVELHPLYAPLSAGQTTAESSGQAVSFDLDGSIGNNGALAFEIAVPPGSGTATLSGRTVTYTPNPGFSGVDRIGYTVSYGLAEVASSAFVTVVSPNQPPAAGNVAASGDEDTAIAIALQGSDPEGQALAYALLSQPASGSLSGVAPNLVYTPAADFAGTDSFTYKVNDGQLDSNVATVIVSVLPVNDAPVANPDSATVKRRTQVSIPVLDNDTDVEGDALSIAAVTAPAQGSVAIAGTSVVYTAPQQGSFLGPVTFQYTASDGRGGTASATVTVTVTK